MEEFNSDAAKKFLKKREEQEKDLREKERNALLKKVITILKEEFKDSAIEVYLVGSIIRPFAFTSRSDVDIVVKNFRGDRLDLWTKLEKKIGKSVEIISYETCEFREFIEKEGMKVI